MTIKLKPHWSDQLLEDARRAGRLPQRRKNEEKKS